MVCSVVWPLTAKVAIEGRYKVLRGHHIDGSNGKTQPYPLAANYIHFDQAHTGARTHPLRIGWGPRRSQDCCSQRLYGTNTCKALGLSSEFCDPMPKSSHRRPVHRTAAECWATGLLANAPTHHGLLHAAPSRSYHRGDYLAADRHVKTRAARWRETTEGPSVRAFDSLRTGRLRL